STRDSLVVTDPTTSLAISGLSRAERTGCRVFHCLWPYVLTGAQPVRYIGRHHSHKLQSLFSMNFSCYMNVHRLQSLILSNSLI
ncbi:hypothetical protein B0T17DRAFT_501401, partial [Bombardia bombarda]